jgi:hypothetical protein
MANGAILWKGPSAIDGAPIVLIATGLEASSLNLKTGALVQTWILRDDMTPQEAVDSGADESICGACPHRGDIVDGKNVNRSCYVTIFQAPRNIWQTAKRGVYSQETLESGRAMLAGRNVRLGAYGDPAAVPFDVWAVLLADSAKGTGYTHQWKACDPRFALYCMASADSLAEAESAQAMGYRTFRVGSYAESVVKGKEFLCPASKEAGQKTNCAACLACGGLSSPNRASVFIPAHGATGKVKAFERRAVAA